MIIGTNHIGISVSDLDRAIAFYQRGLDMEVVSNEAFFGEQYSRILGLDAAKGRVALLQVTNLQLELFEFAHPAPARSDLRRPVCDHGISHFCIEVADIDAHYERLSQAGAYFHCPPLFFPAERAKATYGRDLDGNVFELLEVLGKNHLP